MAKPVQIPGPNALHDFLAQIKEELVTKLVTLKSFRTQLDQLWNEKKQDALEKQKEFLLDIGRDDNGDAISPDIQDALNWLDDGLPDLQEAVEAIAEPIDEAISFVEEKLFDLKDLTRDTRGKFVYDRTGEDDEESTEDIETEADLQTAIKEWRRNFGPETARKYEIQTRMRTGLKEVI